MKKLLISATFLAVAVTPIVGSAAAKTYTAYVLEPLKVNNYTQTHNKETGDQYIENKVTAFTNTDKAIFWAANKDNKQISSDYEQQVNNISKINLTTKMGTGDQVKMGMENAYWKTTNAFVSGEVDFR